MLRDQGQYDQLPLESASLVSDTSNKSWNLERIEINGVKSGTRLILDLYFPKKPRSKYSATVFFPGLGAVLPGERDEKAIRFLDFIPKSGRTLIIPHYRNLWENATTTTMEDVFHPTKSSPLIREWVQDLGRVFAFLQEDERFHSHDTSYLGVSMGTGMGIYMVPYLEQYLGNAIFLSGGIADNSHAAYAPRITIPTILINGDSEYMFPVEKAQVPLYELLGTSPEHKKHVILSGGHVPKKVDIAREVLLWLDKYQPLIEEGQ